jgi:putative sigma-54 modulation protein
MPPPPPDTQQDDVAPPRIVRALRYHVKPLAIDDAAMEVEAGNDGFLVFRNADTGAINVLYRRKNGDLGLIEPER